MHAFAAAMEVLLQDGLARDDNPAHGPSLQWDDRVQMPQAGYRLREAPAEFSI
jgi:hypothetical protein